MSSTSHLTVASTSETKIDKKQRHINWRTLPCDVSSNLLHLSSVPTTSSKYLYYVNVKPTRKQSITTATSTDAPTTSSDSHRRLSPVSLAVPWYKRTHLSSNDKFLYEFRQMSRDHLLPLDKLSKSRIDKTTDDDQTSPLNSLIPFHESVKVNEKEMNEVR